MSVEQLRKTISPKFTEQVLVGCIAKKSGLSDVQIKNIKLRTGSKKGGDSYQSNMVKFTLEGVGKNQKNEEESVSVPAIVKYLPANLAHRKTLRSVNFFENEIIFYEKVWPALDQFQKSKGLQENFDNIPLSLASYSDGVTDFVIMEDLCHYGYENPIRGSSLDYDNTIRLLKIFSDFNALSLAFKDQQPEAFEKAATSLKEVYYSEKFRKWYERFQYDVVFVVFKDAVAKELPPKYVEKFNEILSTDVYGKACELVQVRGPLSVVTHGDAWLPNFLIKYKSSDRTRIENAKLIDFQIARYTTLASDLLHFFFACVDTEVLEKHWDDFLVEYIKGLGEALKKLGSNPNLVTLEQLKADMKATIVYGMAISMEGVMQSVIGEEDVVDLDGVEGDKELPLEVLLPVKPFTSQEKRKRLAAMIKFIIDRELI